MPHLLILGGAVRAEQAPSPARSSFGSNNFRFFKFFAGDSARATEFSRVFHP